ncbi:MAG: hypothetical protein PUP93_34645 [Rhizonema sp. NSF051]|nr:hypothetical protein [Rhizonema sp. NSF051]
MRSARSSFAIAYVADQLKLDVEVWQSRKVWSREYSLPRALRLEAIALLHTTVINRKQKQLESLNSDLAPTV